MAFILAIGANVTMSSQYLQQVPEYLTNGVYDKDPAATDDEQSPWMQIDLGDIFCIAAITTYEFSGSKYNSYKKTYQVK